MLRRESNKDWMKGQIASSLPGRLRLRVEGLGFLFDARMDVAGELATIAGVRRVQVTPCTGSVLLEYDQNSWIPRRWWNARIWCWHAMRCPPCARATQAARKKRLSSR